MMKCYMSKNRIKKNPFDLLDEIGVFKRETTEENDFYEVEKGSKVLKTKEKIKAKNLFEAGIKYLNENCTEINSSKMFARINSNGIEEKINSSGDISQINSNGRYAQIGSSGGFSQINSNGDYAIIGSNGHGTQINSSGNYATIGSIGSYSRINSTGQCAQIISSECDARISSNGDYAQINSNGDYTRIVSMGDKTQIELKGKYSVACCIKNNCIIKGKNGTWITLSEWEYNEELEKNILTMLKSAQIGNEEYTDYKGEILKEDVFYGLINKEFVPIEIIDGCKMVIMSRTKFGEYNIFKAKYIDNYKYSSSRYVYVAERNGYTAHGENVKRAINDVDFKILRSMNIGENIERIKKQGYITANDYRLITGACHYGVNKFLEENNLTWEDKKSIEEVLKLVENQYGYDRFKEFVEILKESGDNNE